MSEKLSEKIQWMRYLPILTILDGYGIEHSLDFNELFSEVESLEADVEANKQIAHNVEVMLVEEQVEN